MTITELEQADTQLSEEELARFRAWFDEYYADLWDKQIEEDAKSGRLDKLIAEVDEARAPPLFVPHFRLEREALDHSRPNWSTGR